MHESLEHYELLDAIDDFFIERGYGRPDLGMCKS